MYGGHEGASKLATLYPTRINLSEQFVLPLQEQQGQQLQYSGRVEGLPADLHHTQPSHESNGSEDRLRPVQQHRTQKQEKHHKMRKQRPQQEQHQWQVQQEQQQQQQQQQRQQQRQGQHGTEHPGFARKASAAKPPASAISPFAAAAAGPGAVHNWASGTATAAGLPSSSDATAAAAALALAAAYASRSRTIPFALMEQVRAVRGLGDVQQLLQQHPQTSWTAESIGLLWCKLVDCLNQQQQQAKEGGRGRGSRRGKSSQQQQQQQQQEEQQLAAVQPGDAAEGEGGLAQGSSSPIINSSSSRLTRKAALTGVGREDGGRRTVALPRYECKQLVGLICPLTVRVLPSMAPEALAAVLQALPAIKALGWQQQQLRRLQELLLLQLVATAAVATPGQVIRSMQGLLLLEWGCEGLVGVWLRMWGEQGVMGDCSRDEAVVLLQLLGRWRLQVQEHQLHEGQGELQQEQLWEQLQQQQTRDQQEARDDEQQQLQDVDLLSSDVEEPTQQKPQLQGQEGQAAGSTAAPGGSKAGPEGAAAEKRGRARAAAASASGAAAGALGGAARAAVRNGNGSLAPLVEGLCRCISRDLGAAAVGGSKAWGKPGSGLGAVPATPLPPQQAVAVLHSLALLGYVPRQHKVVERLLLVVEQGLQGLSGAQLCCVLLSLEAVGVQPWASWQQRCCAVLQQRVLQGGVPGPVLVQVLAGWEGCGGGEELLGAVCRGIASCWEEVGVEELVTLPVVLLGLRYKPAKYWVEGYYAAVERQWGGVCEVEVGQLVGMVVGWGWMGRAGVDVRCLGKVEAAMVAGAVAAVPAAVHGTSGDVTSAANATRAGEVDGRQKVVGAGQQQQEHTGLSIKEAWPAYQGFQCLGYEPGETWCSCFLTGIRKDQRRQFDTRTHDFWQQQRECEGGESEGSQQQEKQLQQPELRQLSAADLAGKQDLVQVDRKQQTSNMSGHLKPGDRLDRACAAAEWPSSGKQLPIVATVPCIQRRLHVFWNEQVLLDVVVVADEQIGRGHGVPLLMS